MPTKKFSAEKATEQAETTHTILLDLLAKIDRPGDFCLAGDREFVLPGLEVDGMGTIGLPLSTSTAAKLIKACSQAPYGKGTETVVDTKVRRVWELDPSRFQLTNPGWKKCVDEILKESQVALGLEKQKLTAHLYKLLVYVEGSFFLPHRDGEKIDGMVATLVIVLPSKHSGGELVVSHDNQTRTVLFPSAAAGHGLSYALFYADCEHEVKKLTTGFRVCLTYNVTLSKSTSKRTASSKATSREQQSVLAPSYGETIRQVADLLVAQVERPESWKLAITLDHAYTKDGLKLELLKGTDRAKADAMFAAAELAGCVAHLAILTHWQSGSAEGDYDYGSSGYGRSRRYSRAYDEFESNEEDSKSDCASSYSMGEVYEHSLKIDHWSDRNSKSLLLGEMPLDESEVVSADSIDDWETSREEFEGYTGNAGMTLERWYHRAAIVIWPRKQHFHILCEAGTDASIAGLNAMVTALKRSSKANQHARYQDCLTFANSIVDTWKPVIGSYWSSSNEKIETIDRSVFANIVAKLDDVELIKRFFVEVLPNDGKVQINAALVERCERYGWNRFDQSLTDVAQRVTIGTLERNLSLLERLCSGRSVSMEQRALCSRLLDVFVESAIAFDMNDESARVNWNQSLDRSKVLETLVDVALTIGNEKALKIFVDHTLAVSKHYALTEAHLKAIFSLAKRFSKQPEKKISTAFVGWLKACQSELESRTASPQQPPIDFQRSARMGCTCADCQHVAAFLKDPNTKQLRYPVAKQRRQHLHGQIDSNQLDLTHVTDRRGTPQTLVLTKTIASYEAAQKVHDLYLTNLAHLNKLLQKMN